MITLKCSLNKSIVSCDIKQPYILPIGSIDKDTLSESLKNELDNKIDKEDGKGLSTNDYTDTDKAEVEKVKDKADKSACTPFPLFDENKRYKNGDIVWCITSGGDNNGIGVSSTGRLALYKCAIPDDLPDEYYSHVSPDKNMADWEYISLDSVDFTDYASADKAGVVTVSSGMGGIRLDGGDLSLYIPTESQIDERYCNFKL